MVMQTRQADSRADVLDRELEAEVGEDKYYVTRPHTSVRRYDRPAQRDAQEDPTTGGMTGIRRRSSREPVTGVENGMTSKAMSPPATKKAPLKIGARRSRLPIVAIIVGMLAMSALVMSFSALASWWQIHQDDVTYGRPRTFQMDAVVGHNDSPSNPSHFIFMNLNRHVVIIELPGGDATHARIYNGPTLFGNGQDLIPITAEFRDVNGDGKPDMIVFIQDQRLVYINDGTEFRPLKPGEQVNLGQ